MDSSSGVTELISATVSYPLRVKAAEISFGRLKDSNERLNGIGCWLILSRDSTEISRERNLSVDPMARTRSEVVAVDSNGFSSSWEPTGET